MTVPLRHFLVALGLLLFGVAIGLGIVLDVISGGSTLAHVHLLLTGWVCVTIMGAMTQFVPVWSGVELYSQRLSTVQLWLVTGGLVGFAVSLLLGEFAWTPVFGAAMLLGFWVFAYNIGRTLRRCSEYDVTERHFALALGFFLLVTTFGFLLALGFVYPVFATLGVTRGAVIESHATLAVFGAVVTTIVGALYQLGPMFTQTELGRIDSWLQRVEEVGYPVGVLLLATGRLVEFASLARVGGLFVTLSLLGFSVVFGRRLYESSVGWNPMLARYAVAAPALAVWGLLTLPSWLANPLARDTLFGAPATVHLFAVGFVGFVIFGTLYHVVPFIVWVHRYSDRLGYESVPMVDDLYSTRLATLDFGLLVGGSVVLVAADLFALPTVATGLGSAFILVGVALFITNVLSVIRTHSPHSLFGVLVTTLFEDAEPGHDSTDSVDTR